VKHDRNIDYCKAFGAHLKRLRIEKGIKKRQFALDSEMEYSHLAKIERGDTNPTISTIHKLAVALKMTPRELFDFKFPVKTKTK
jgi:transcriptional regulator with XRE-family HTH domain